MLRKLVFLLFAACAVSALPRPSDSETTSSQDDVCSLPPEKTGPIACLAAIPKWTFNAKTAACERYLYGGCGGTENLFEKEFDCLARCNRKALLRPAEARQARETAANATSPCLLPLAPGNCRAHIVAYHFDAEAKTCNSFTYTGCRGNENNFATIEDCQETCREFLASPPVTAVTLPAAVSEVKMTKEELCSLPPVKPSPIACLAFVPMWTHNATSQQCERYVYGGCGATANLFKSEEACQSACGPETIGFKFDYVRKKLSISQGQRQRKDSCLLPVTSGPCFGHQPRFAFKKEKNRCEMFTFGGCQGNANNFRTAQECYNACGGDEPNTVPECEKVTCPIENNHYMERGCLPVYTGKSCCPTSFECPEDKQTGVCYYRGVPFQVGQEISMVTQDDPCKTHCMCEASSKHTGGATITCQEIFCDWPQKPDREGCVLVHPPNKCCPSYQCSDAPAEGSPAPEVCVHNGKQYALGQYIPTGQPCKACVCVEGFSGLDGPGCRDIHCIIDNRIGMVPVYTKNVCCPTGYKNVESVSLSANKSRIIRVEPEPGKQGVTTLPIAVPENWRVKSKICLLPKVTGPCKMSRPSFYYDSEANECRSFLYGGCQGNDNRFDTAEDCLNACRIQPDQEEKETARSIDIDPEPSQQGVQEVSNDRCSLPMHTGPCRMSIEQFYYDSATGECLLFYYGGCKGNANRFNTVEDCRSACKTKVERDGPIISIQEPGKQGISTLPARLPQGEKSVDRCRQPKNIGPCRMSLEQYYFDVEKGECVLFYYGGCRGNANRFDTAEACMNACRGTTKVERDGPFITIQEPGKQGVMTLPARVESNQERDGRVIRVQEPGKQGVTTLPSRVPEQSNVDRCRQPKNMGPCRMALEQYYYDVEKGECVLFYYGGCRGNANRFDTAEACMNACRGTTKVERDGPFITIQEPGKQGVMTLPARVESNQVERDGPFISIQEAGKQGVSTLPARITGNDGDKSVCRLPQEIGPCRSAVLSYSYNAETGECESFWYGGCRGNDNRFDSEEECLSRCGNAPAPLAGRARSSSSGQPKKDKCELPADVGFCRGHQERFYYDAATRQCKTFVWGGCFGNANNFASEQECLAACAPSTAPAGIASFSAARGAARARVSSLPEADDHESARGALAGARLHRARNAQQVCTFGNLTLNLGDQLLDDEDPCEVCECLTPPEVTCTRQTCPSPPPVDQAVCEYEFVPGQCCPNIACVSANPPWIEIDVCESVTCKASERCEVTSQESEDGSWLPPIGVCVPNTP